MPRIKPPTRAQVEHAVEILAQHGRAAFKSSHTRRGTAVGFALYSLLSANEVTDAAIEAFEQSNGHLSVAALRAIEMGDGEVSRRGRNLTIRLPEHWA